MNYKYVLQDIIAVAHYLYSHLLKRKEIVYKLYRPFINHYFLPSSLQESSESRVTPSNRFKVCAWAVVALIRMKKEVSSGRGILRYAKNAIEKRYSIKNLSSHV